MTGLLILAAALLLTPVAVRRRVRRRLTRIEGDRPEPDGRRLRLLIAVVVGLLLIGLLGLGTGLPAGLAAGVTVERYLRRREPGRVRRERAEAAAALPLGADLLAVALRSGAPLDRAAEAVADALGGPLGERLQRTARALRLGAGPEEAWTHLADVRGAHRLRAAAVRSSASGGALAGALTRIADDLRADRAAAVEAAGQRSAVLLVLPLGACYLPAFVLAGLVPVVISMLHSVL